MKIRNTLLICSFFVHAVSAAPMWKSRRGTTEPGEYGSVNLEQRTAISRRKAGDEDEESKEQQHSSGISTVADPTIRMQQQDVSIDSSVKFLGQKIAEAQGVAQKWSGQLEQQSDPINEEGIRTILQAATADLEYWIDQKRKVDEFLSENRLETTRRALFLSLSQAASQAIQEANRVAEFYLSLSKACEPEQSKLRSLGESFFGSSNPLIRGAARPLPTNRDDLKTIKAPSRQGPLMAGTLQNVLERWPGNAEIRYDSSVEKYVSEQVQPSGLLEGLARAVARTQIEREQHREAIEKVALEQGADLAARFKTHVSIRVKNIFGEPLTPTLIKKVQEDFKREDRISARNVIIHPSGLSTFGRFLEGVATQWESFRSRRNNQYQPIPEDKFPKVAPMSPDMKGSRSYQG